jgi:hypothetical protein
LYWLNIQGKIFMTRLIKQFTDGSYLKYDSGKFDDWCIYLVQPNGSSTAPLDVNYFSQFQSFAKKYGARKIYDDFVTIYDQTDQQLNPKLLSQITALAENYRTDALQLDKLFSIIYAGMVAEENKQNAVLKKRIKRLGMHQLLIENQSPEYAANFSRGKKWRVLDEECHLHGF